MEQLTIRGYRAQDYQGVRDVCYATGFLGEPISQVFSDKEIVADLFTKYYTDIEPESAFVIENQGKIVGYVLGCRDSKKLRRYFLTELLPRIVPKLIWHYFAQYNRRERRWARRVTFDGLRGSFRSSPRSAHLHINLMKKCRGRGVGKLLINKFFQYMREQGIEKIYGGVWAFDDRKTQHLYRKLGFEIRACRESNIFKGVIEKRVYALELVRDLTGGEWRIK